jgi:hypothetical protein
MALQISACYLFYAGFSLVLFFDPEDGGEIFLRNVALIFNGPHDVISQKTGFIIITAVGTSNSV